MHINTEAREIYLSPEESDRYAVMTTDERGAYAVKVTRELHKIHPRRPEGGERFSVVNTSAVLLFYVFTY